MADEKQGIFRKVALERLSSPEQLDQLVQVTNPTGWLALGGLGAVLLATLVWGIFGSIPMKLSGTGIMIRSGGVFDVVSTGTGPLEKVHVNVGDEVKAGQIVADLHQPKLLDAVDDAEAGYLQAKIKYQDVLSFTEEHQQLSGRDIDRQKDNYRVKIAGLERQIAVLEEKMANEQKLLEKNLVTKQVPLTTEKTLSATRNELNDNRLALQSLETTKLQQSGSQHYDLETAKQVLLDAKLRLDQAQKELEDNAQLRSPYDGRVLEMLQVEGSIIRQGESLLTLELLNRDLQAVLYVPAGGGKEVETNMIVQISPAAVKQEEYGFMLGKVTRVSAFPSTPRGMMRLLANDALVKVLSAQGPPLEIEVELAKDPATPSGYQWSSSAGPELRLSSGTMFGANIVLRRDRPIALLIPAIRKKLGI